MMVKNWDMRMTAVALPQNSTHCAKLHISSKNPQYLYYKKVHLVYSEKQNPVNGCVAKIMLIKNLKLCYSNTALF